ncbi:unnamed protein product [Mytilus coruscus]|uniref:Uncharacterized protein n=1 Tax=Mytilus coruscus TaxID=42192 RepID=A0A6J8EJM8_MYTCO|nr:unnamed protein product [Mytilus coruscus]
MQNADVRGSDMKYSSVPPIYNSNLQTGPMTPLIINQLPIVQHSIQQARSSRSPARPQLITNNKYQSQQQQKGNPDRKHMTVQERKRRDRMEHTENISELIQEVLNDTTATRALDKVRYKAKPTLDVWSVDIKAALDEMRKYYALWVEQGKSKDRQNSTYQHRIQTRKKFRRQAGIENARTKEEEKIQMDYGN